MNARGCKRLLVQYCWVAGKHFSIALGGVRHHERPPTHQHGRNLRVQSEGWQKLFWGSFLLICCGGWLLLCSRVSTVLAVSTRFVCFTLLNL
jgi:hypothetical protein